MALLFTNHENADICPVSDLEPDFVKGPFLTLCGNVQAVFGAAMEKMGSNVIVLGIPYGRSALPRCSNKKNKLLKRLTLIREETEI